MSKCNCGRAIAALSSVLFRLLRDHNGTLDGNGCPMPRPDYPEGASEIQIACADAAYAQYLAECAACGQDLTCQQNATSNFLTAWNGCFAAGN